MATPEWLALKSDISRAIDGYLADQRKEFGRVEVVPVNAILDRVAVPKEKRKKVRSIISLTLKERGWKREQSGASHTRTKMWVLGRVEA